MTDIVFLSAVRTGFGTFGGALKDHSATDLGVIAAEAAAAPPGPHARLVDHAILGKAMPASGRGM